MLTLKKVSSNAKSIFAKVGIRKGELLPALLILRLSDKYRSLEIGNFKSNVFTQPKGKLST